MTTNPQPAVRVDARVKELEWTEPTPPNDECHYDHVIAPSALGPFRIEWKSWKEHDSFGVYLDGFYIESGRDLPEAKSIAQDHLRDTILSALTPAPTEAGGVREALTAIIADWDSRSVGEQERFVPPSDGLPGYWSPNARMVPSERIAAGRAALSSTPAADAGWQDISTHKADAIKGAYSPHVLCAHAGKGWRRFGRYYLTLKRWYYSGTDERSQWAQVEGDEPTHWMPLPPLPAPPLNPEARDER